MASREEVEEKLDVFVARLHASDEGSRALGDSLPEPRVLALHVTDHDAHYWTDLDGGRMGGIRGGAHHDPHIRIAASSDDLVRLIDGDGGLFSAYLAGRIRIEASFSDLWRLRGLVS